jgi:hypothetical protein
VKTGKAKTSATKQNTWSPNAVNLGITFEYNVKIIHNVADTKYHQNYATKKMSSIVTTRNFLQKYEVILTAALKCISMIIF